MSLKEMSLGANVVASKRRGPAYSYLQKYIFLPLTFTVGNLDCLIIILIFNKFENKKYIPHLIVYFTLFTILTLLYHFIAVIVNQ